MQRDTIKVYERLTDKMQYIIDSQEEEIERLKNENIRLEEKLKKQNPIKLVE